LFLGSREDNNADKKAKGRERWNPLKGNDHGMAKLGDVQVIEIRNSTESNAAVAKRLGINASTVSRIRSRKIWAHL